MRYRAASSLGLSVVLCLAACGDDDGGGFVFADTTPPPPSNEGGPPGDAPPVAGTLRIDPADREETIRDGAPAVVEYRAFLTEPGGAERDVTSETVWTSSVPALGTFEGATFTSAPDRGGRTIIGARYVAVNATTNLTLRLERVVVGLDVPADAPTLFGGAPAASGGPEIVYPEDGVWIPPNLRELEVHYRTGSHSLFEIRFRASELDLKIYVGCPEAVTGGCIFTPDDEIWDTLAMAARGSGTVQLDVRGTDGMGGPVGSSPTRELTVVEEDITGGLYYWNAAAGTINRFEFGRRGARAEVFLDQPRTGAGVCVGCHALSRDGRRIAVGLDIPVTTFQTYDVASRSRIFNLGGGFPAQPTFFTFSPDSTQMATGGGRAIDIRDAVTGMVTIPNVGPNGAMPDWSPDGMRIVYARTALPLPIDSPGIQSGSIELLEFDGSRWQQMPTLVPRMGDNNYYPAFSPDGEWVVYNRSPSDAGSMGGDMSGVADAQLWVISLDGTRVMQLERAGGLGDSWPKWDPTIYRNGGQTIFWLSWASRRGYGLRYASGSGHTQIWMAAFSPTEARANHDPAMPAFRLPFQDISSGNHIAQWVTSIERMTCTSDDECGGEFCIDGVCVPEFI